MVQRERPEEISQPDLNEEATIASQRLLESAQASQRQPEAAPAPTFDMGKLRAMGASVGFGSFESGSTEISRIPVGLGQSFGSSEMSTRITPENSASSSGYAFAGKQNYYQVRHHRLAEQRLQADA